jgi:hypothetical protein
MLRPQLTYRCPSTSAGTIDPWVLVVIPRTEDKVLACSKQVAATEITGYIPVTGL